MKWRPSCQCEDDIMLSTQWSTDSLDIFDMFTPGPANLDDFKEPKYTPAARITSLTRVGH